MKKNMVYFVLYIVLLSELLIVITERDDLQAFENEMRNKMLATLVEMYKQPVLLNIPQRETSYEVGAKSPAKVVLTPTGLVSDNEKNSVKYIVDIPEGSRKPKAWPKGGVTIENSNKQFKIYKNNDNAVFVAAFDKPGEYKFEAYCEVDRKLPDYLPKAISDSLLKQIGGLKKITSKEENFEINAKSLGGVKSKKAEISF